PSLQAGDIAAIVGLRDAQTGDTYSPKAHFVRLEPIQAFESVITLALEPLNSDEGKILDEALARYAEEDPTLKFSLDEDSGLRMLSGMGELHLDVTLERLEREYKIRPRPGQPQVVLRETVSGCGSARVNFDRELGKERHQGEVELEICPRERGEGNLVTDYLPQDPQEARKILPEPMRTAVREAVENALATGVATGWPITDVAVHIKSINRMEGLTTLPGLAMAASQALRDAMAKAGAINLEPVMDVEINCPEESLGAAINLFNQTGGRIENLEDHAGAKIVRGHAPMRKLFGFSTSLRSATQGRAGFAASFRSFDQV
ncbi:MAG: elongation factor G, partial [Desulfovibrio sp.]|nr:elongation factor G [Desulfovibrio sp.]